MRWMELDIAICDDEKYARKLIRNLIEKQGIRCKVTEFSSGKELLEVLRQKAVDILFLDVSMEGMDGMAVAKQLRSQAGERGEAVWGSLPLLIFVTGYPEYMMDAFSVNAFQFLVKPIKEQEFAAVFAQAVREWRCLAARRQKPPRELLVRAGNATRKVLVEDIYYVESSNRKVILSLSHEKIIYYGKIGQLEEEFPKSFFRVHKGYLVNMKYVERYSRTEVRMKNGDVLLISKYKYQEFVKAYLDYILEENY
jgi:DNA-binding LytR/AlgR family response regulator